MCRELHRRNVVRHAEGKTNKERRKKEKKKDKERKKQYRSFVSVPSSLPGGCVQNMGQGDVGGNQLCRVHKQHYITSAVQSALPKLAFLYGSLLCLAECAECGVPNTTK